MVGEVVSINVSEIKDVKWKGEIVRTGIFKDPTQGPVEIKGVNIIGDDQADRKAHGGLDKAIYSYAVEHYPYFRERFPDLKWQNGMFGENLTTTGIFEDETYVGDIFEIGSVQLIAVQPREPCFKLGIRFGTQKIVKTFYQTDFSGIYYKIAKEGIFKAGDQIKKIHEDSNRFSIKRLLDLFKNRGPKEEIIRAGQLEHLPQDLKQAGEYLLSQMD